MCNLSRSPAAEFSGDSRFLHWPVDLADPQALASAAESVLERLRAESSGPVLLINNSGFGQCGCFASPRQDELGMIDLNVRAVVDLSARVLPLLRERGGAIINLASLAAFQPTPYMATYGASKAFILNWSLALNEELRAERIPVLAVCPGPTDSRFHLRAGFSEPLGLGGQTAAAVVEESLRALHRRQAFVVTGRRNRWVARGGRLLPKVMLARLSRRVLKRLRLDAVQRVASHEQL